ncbi:hypothetical protein [Ruminococcus sp.]|uniref:P-type ATPase n=1 Tax=Ruminococcus sp. TaxID=41978 RepID=UPI00300EBA83
MNRQEKITKTTGQILRENICTLFNLLNLLIAVALVYVHAWSNLFFIFVIAFNTIIGIAQEIKAKRLIEKLSLLSAPKAEVERNGKVQEIAVEEIELEDILLLDSGKQICADATVVEGTVEVNESLLTGESDAILKKAGDSLLSGSSVISGKCRAQVIHVGSDNYAAKIAREGKENQGDQLGAGALYAEGHQADGFLYRAAGCAPVPAGVPDAGQQPLRCCCHYLRRTAGYAAQGLVPADQHRTCCRHCGTLPKKCAGAGSVLAGKSGACGRALSG